MALYRCISEIIAKYRDRLKGMETEVESVKQEEEAERSLTRAEIEANKALKMLEENKGRKAKKRKNGKLVDGDERQRVWFQSQGQRSDGKFPFILKLKINCCTKLFLQTNHFVLFS